MSSFFILLLMLVVIIFFIRFKDYRKRFQKLVMDYFIILMVVVLVVCIIIFPNQSVKAAYEGLKVWFAVVLPALLPFFIGSELLVGLGVVKFIGTLLEPIMRPLFNVPGEGSFAFAMSVTSGYPVGVKITTKLRSEGLLSKIEAQRLVSFCSTSGPLFLIGAVSIGMFQSSEVGLLLAICHYTAAIVVGLFFSFYKRSSSEDTSAFLLSKHKNLIKKAFVQLNIARKKNPPFGILLGNAVRESINTMLMVGGFIVLFSVIINIFDIVGLIDVVANCLYFLFQALPIDFSIIKGLITGLFEITIGCKMIADTLHAALIHRIAAAGFIIGWSGFSIHAQSISILSTTDINLYLYIFSKLLHGIFSYLLVYLVYPIFTVLYAFTTPTFYHHEELSLYEKIINNLTLSIEIFLMLFVGVLLISLLTGFFIMTINNFKGKKRNK